MQIKKIMVLLAVIIFLGTNTNAVAINLLQLDGQKESGTWYVGFTAKALSTSTSGTVSMSSFKIDIEYECNTRKKEAMKSAHTH